MPQRYFTAGEAKQLRCMVDDSGSAASIVRDEGTVPQDVSKPWLGNTAIEVSYSGTALVTKVSKSNIDDDTILITDQVALFAPASITVEPTTDDYFEQGGTRFSIVHARPLHPGSNELIWRLVIRR